MISSFSVFHFDVFTDLDTVPVKEEKPKKNTTKTRHDFLQNTKNTKPKPSMKPSSPVFTPDNKGFVPTNRYPVRSYPEKTSARIDFSSMIENLNHMFKCLLKKPM